MGLGQLDSNPLASASDCTSMDRSLSPPRPLLPAVVKHEQFQWVPHLMGAVRINVDDNVWKSSRTLSTTEG